MEFLSRNPNAEKIAKELVHREGVQPLVETQQEIDHKHEWDLLSKTYAPPRREIQQAVDVGKDTLDRMLFGVTVFLWECLVCKILRKEQVLGSDITQLDEMIDKADKYGTQYIQRNDGTTFVLTRYQPQVASLPMR